MKITTILIFTPLSTLLFEQKVYPAKFINKTERSIVLRTLDGKIVLDTIAPKSCKIVETGSCKVQIKNDKEYSFEHVHSHWSVIFAETTNGKIYITCIETQD